MPAATTTPLDLLYARRPLTAADLAPGEYLPGYGGRPLDLPATPPTTGGTGYRPLDLTQPPPAVRQTAQAITDYLQGPPPAARPNAGGIISRGNEVYTVAPGFDTKLAPRGLERVLDMPPPAPAPFALPAFAPPKEALAQVKLAGQRAQFDFSQPPPAPVDRGRALTANLVNIASNAPGATMQDVTGALSTAATLTAPPKVDRIGQTVDVKGTPFVFTQNGNLAPVPKPPTPTIDFSQPPPIKTVDGVRFYQPAPNEPWRQVQDKAPGTTLSSDIIRSTVEDITKTKQELDRQEAAVLGGDNRYGFLNALSRSSKIEELKAKIASKEAYLRDGGVSPLAFNLAEQPPTTSAKPAAPAATATAPAAPAQAKLYQVSGDKIQFPTDRTQLLPAVQQALNDGLLDEAGARNLLTQSGFKPKAAAKQ